MKKTLLALTLVLALGIGSMVVFAETTRPETSLRGLQGFPCENFTEEERLEFFNERNEYRNEYRKENLKKALEDGRITEAQAKEWEEHFKYMDEFHEKNGFMGGGCGNGYGMMRGNNKGHGGMRRGNRF